MHSNHTLEGLTAAEIAEVVFARRSTDRTIEQIRRDSMAATVAKHFGPAWVQVAPGHWVKPQVAK
jgi:hypothetical protein